MCRKSGKAKTRNQLLKIGGNVNTRNPTEKEIDSISTNQTNDSSRSRIRFEFARENYFYLE